MITTEITENNKEIKSSKPTSEKVTVYTPHYTYSHNFYPPPGCASKKAFERSYQNVGRERRRLADMGYRTQGRLAWESRKRSSAPFRG